jgi:MoxR-like ATPase
MSGAGEGAAVQGAAVQGAAVQVPPPEVRYADELVRLATEDSGPRPPSWRLSPRSVVRFVMGDGEGISTKFVGDRALVERAVITLAGSRGLLLVGEPGTAKSMLSELLAAAICGTSALTVQGTAGSTEEHLRYGWNYAMLLASGPRREALVPSPVMTAMETGGIARIEEVTRCLPEVQDALVSLLSDRRLSVPELGPEGVVYARPGFNIIATANLRDRGVSEMSAALKRRLNFETVPAIAEARDEIALVRRQVAASVAPLGAGGDVEEVVLDALVTAFRDLRGGRTAEGWAVEKPGAVMSTAEAVGVASSIALDAAWFPERHDGLGLLPGYLLGVVLKDDPKDRGRLLAYWDGAVRRRADPATAHPRADVWRRLHALRRVLEEG